MAKLKLNTELVERQRRRMGLRPSELARRMGISRQAYWMMIHTASAAKAEKLAAVFDLDKKALVYVV